MTLDGFSVLNTQQCFFIFFCSVDTENNIQSFTEKLLSESVEEFTSTNFNSQNVIIASFHIPSGEICAKLTSCLSLHHFSNFR